jgi:hypothetical protein
MFFLPSSFSVFPPLTAIALFFTNYGRWLEDQYTLTTEQIGGVTIAIGHHCISFPLNGALLGVADVTSELLVSMCADRVGIERGITGFSALFVASFILLYFVGNLGLAAAIASVFLVQTKSLQKDSLTLFSGVFLLRV